MGLRFTAAGAVSTPTAVQLRLTRSYPGRVAAGAPEPSRTLTQSEVLANLEYFAKTLEGPRSRACSTLVLAGVSLGSNPWLAAAVTQGRAWGLSRVVLHLGRGDRDALAASPLHTAVDAIAMTVRDEGDMADLAALRTRAARGGRPAALTAVVMLDEASLPRLSLLARGLRAARPDRVVLTWPLSPAAPPPRAERVAAELPTMVSALDAAGITVGIKGLPACRLGPLAGRLWRSSNRYYVDAEHQCAKALLFFPDVMRFAKRDVCRFCPADARCDGAPERWLAQGLAGVLRPVQPD